MALRNATVTACALMLYACAVPAASSSALQPWAAGSAAPTPAAGPTTSAAATPSTTTPAQPTPTAAAGGAAPVMRGAPPAAVPAAHSGNTSAAAPGAPMVAEVTGPAGLHTDPSTGELVFRTDALSLAPGMEAYTCFAASTTEDVVIDGFSKSNQPFVHHAQFVKALAPEPEGLSSCNEQFKLTWMPIFLAGAGASELRFDEGIGHVTPVGTQLVLQMHLLNVTDTPIAQKVEIRMHRSSSANPTPVSAWAIGSSQIQVPARSPGRAENVCNMHGPVELLAVFPHMHTMGKRFSVEVGKSLGELRPLYTRDPYDFDDQRMEKVNLKLEAGDVLRVTCDYMNPTDSVVSFGESTHDEMCFFVGFALGALPNQAECPNLWEALFTL